MECDLSHSILDILDTQTLTSMLINQVEHTYSVYPDKVLVTVYDRTLYTESNKHTLNTYTYTIELYTNKGDLREYTNTHSVDLYA